MIDELLKTFKIERLLIKRGCQYDNAIAKSTYKIIKTEFTFKRRFNSFEKLEIELFNNINWYNNVRINSSLNYLPLVNIKKCPYKICKKSVKNQDKYINYTHCKQSVYKCNN